MRRSAISQVETFAPHHSSANLLQETEKLRTPQPRRQTPTSWSGIPDYSCPHCSRWRRTAQNYLFAARWRISIDKFPLKHRMLFPLSTNVIQKITDIPKLPANCRIISSYISAYLRMRLISSGNRRYAKHFHARARRTVIRAVWSRTHAWQYRHSVINAVDRIRPHDPCESNSDVLRVVAG
jgi:hypothetical protein